MNSLRSTPSRASPRWFDIWAIVLLTVPIYGTFFPPESYFGEIADTSKTAGNVYSTTSLPITPVSLVLISLTTVLMYMKVRQNRRIVHNPLAYLFVFAAAITIFWSPEPQLTFQRVLRLLPPVALGVLFPQYYERGKLLRLMTISFLLSAIASIAVALFFPAYGNGGLGYGYESAWRGALLHKNAAGFIYATGLIVSCYAWMSRNVRWWLCMLTAILCAILVIKTDSATAAVSVVASLIIGFTMASLRHVPRAALGLLGMAGLILAMFVIAIANFAPELLVSAIGRDMTLTGRTDIWAAVIALIPEHPIRGFYYCFWYIDSAARDSVVDAVGYRVAYSHNSWLDLWLQTGLLGLFAIAILSIRGVVSSVGYAFRERGVDATFYFVLSMFLLIRSITEVEFVEPGTAGVFWLVLATTAVKAADRSSAKQGGMPARVGRPLALGANA